MEKKWSKVAEGSYSFQVDGAEVGKMDIAWGSLTQKAQADMDGKIFRFKRNGFWKTILEITDKNDLHMAKVYPEKWYSNTSVLEYKGASYRLQLRNRNLAEYAVMRDGQDILTYGLFLAKRKTEVRISDSGIEFDYFFDALLWYLFAPIAVENMGDSFIVGL
jgi:hypothetical protein